MLADPQHFTAPNQFIAAGVFDDPPDTEFAVGRDRILDGIGTLVSAAGETSGAVRTTGDGPRCAGSPRR